MGFKKIRAFLKKLSMLMMLQLVTLHSAFVVVWMCEQKKSNGETVFGISSESKRTAVNDFTKQLLLYFLMENTDV